MENQNNPQSKKIIVVVENDSDILELIALILEEDGFKVIPVLNESDLFRLNETPDLIILDNWLNERTGHDICLDLKNNEETMHTPVILISASSDLPDVAISCKADTYISKPFDIDFFISTVKKMINGN